MPHVQQTDVGRDGGRHRRRARPTRATFAAATLFTIGFCMGGRAAFLTADARARARRRDRLLRLAGRTGPGRLAGSRSTSRAGSRAPILGLFGGADQGIPPEAIAAFDEALDATPASRTGSSTYEGAPHSFFDRKADEFAAASEEAWAQILGFVRQPPSQ